MAFNCSFTKRNENLERYKSAIVLYTVYGVYTITCNCIIAFLQGTKPVNSGSFDSTVNGQYPSMGLTGRGSFDSAFDMQTSAFGRTPPTSLFDLSGAEQRFTLPTHNASTQAYT